MSGARGRERPESPLALAGASPAGLRSLWILGVLAAAQALALILVAEGLARGLTGLLAGGGTPEQRAAGITGALFLAVGGAALRAAATWLTGLVAARAATGVKESLRARLARRVVDGGGRDIPLGEGRLAIAATRSLDDVDEYFTAVLPAMLASAAVPAILVARFVLADWVSALIVVLCLPLVPVFMILIGRYTQDRVQDAQDALDRLSHSLVELIRGLPVLIGLGRAGAQRETLVRLTRDYRATTMTTLRVAFISALALEFIATISVAVVAVFIGVRLVYGHLDLQTGLMVLILAPECFTPLRRLGAAFHASENGMAAYRRLRDVLVSRPSAAAGRPRQHAGEPLTVRGLELRFADRRGPVLSGLGFTVAPGEHLVLRGASGSGKSSVLTILAGSLRPGPGITVSGELTGMPAPGETVLLPQQPRFLADDAAEEVLAYAPAGWDRTRARAVIRNLGVDPDRPVPALSPGEQRRLGLARVLARVDGGARLVLLDEPTAHLDRDAAALVLRALADLRGRVTMISATHDPAVTAVADRAISVDAAGAQDGREATETPELPDGSSAAEPVPQRPLAPDEDLRGPARYEPPAAGRPGDLLAELVAVLQPWRPRFLLAVLTGIGAAAAAIALTAVSGWLIVRASYQPPIMMLLVAIVGVRFFGLARAVLRYCERLLLHDAVLQSMTALRLRVWDALVRRGPAHRELLRGPVALRRLIADVDEVRDLAPRAVTPLLSGVLLTLGAAGGLSFIAPAAGTVLLLAAGGAVLGGCLITMAADGRAGVRTQASRLALLRDWAAFLGAREDLVAGGAAERVLARLACRDREAGRQAVRVAAAAGLGQAWAVLLCLLGAAAMLWQLAPETAAGALPLELLAVCVLVPLAFVDVCIDGIAAVHHWPRLRRALLSVRALRDESAGHESAQPADGDGPGVPPVRSLVLEDVAARWPGAPDEAFSGVTARMAPGDWLTVTGPSGSGKTTLLSVILAFLPPSRGRYELNGADARGLAPAQLAGRIAWCPQEAHVFDSTVRANLLLARDPAQAPDEARMLRVLAEAGLGEFAAALPQGLDTPVGPGGSLLSGGQRQRLAVARTLLTGAEVIVLDEPTAHLDDQTAMPMMSRLRDGMAGGERTRMTVLVTHDERLADPADARVRLGRAPVRA
ncbi:thiol reductant ABC exporter subunit CydC [Sediminivirga luteola]|uniref:thiol reductant ABC exporter subunit CydC n=1 Tax=Sediminivirga luteola TaxID=1774748 RepID=UPI001F5914FE|nr:thiol reductant ABC exporter subunit CydC [Sediminivirga luteola]MCI2266189.1 thiol reductant ABC exporter subunit CydC [Sediminivirga luteola]